MTRRDNFLSWVKPVYGQRIADACAVLWLKEVADNPEVNEDAVLRWAFYVVARRQGAN